MFYSNVGTRENKMESNGRVESSQNRKCEIKKITALNSTKSQHDTIRQINVQELNTISWRLPVLSGSHR